MARQRITVTLKYELVKRLDATIDGDRIRNRSHAVESILNQALLVKPIKILILAGGKLASFPQAPPAMPKALLPVAGKPLLEHTIDRLREQKLTDIVISLGDGGQKVRDYFRDGYRFGVDISYLEQSGYRRGTAQPLKQAQTLFSSDTFLLLYGDVLADMDYRDLLEYHRSQAGLAATMALTSVERVSMWGVARLVGSKIVEFQEKPKNPKTHSHLVNTGIYVMEPSIFRFITPEMFKLESSVFPRLAEENKLGGYSSDGMWRDISTAEAWSRAGQEIGK